MEKVMVTGGAGFIGFHTAAALLITGCDVAIYDNFNSYYSVKLKEDRVEELKEISNEDGAGKLTIYREDIADARALERAFAEFSPGSVVHLAAQPGVRYSIENPQAYIQSNIVGTFNVLEACRHHPVRHLVMASSSSVYGGNPKVPFSESDPVDCPESLYAATKKSDELMAYTYSKLYMIPTTALRFFTVYGSWGRPDMAAFLFTQRMLNGEPIQVFNKGDLYRDFTYVGDITGALIRVLANPPIEDERGTSYKLYNIGNSSPVRVLDFITILEKLLGVKAKKQFMPMQPGDVYRTYADVSALERDFDYHPGTPLESGLKVFVDWYRGYYRV